MPLDLHWELIALRSFLRTQLLSTSPLKALFAPEAFPTSPCQFAQITYSLLESSSISANPSVLEFRFTGIPPWTFPPTQVYLSLASFPKAAEHMRSGSQIYAATCAISIDIYG